MNHLNIRFADKRALNRGSESALGRREFVKMMAASLAMMGMSACTKQPIHPIIPYVKQPEEITLGVPLFFATAMPHAGYGLGLVVKSYEGHPVKIEGNPSHPISLGGSNVFMQAALLDLYNPTRAKTVSEKGEIRSFSLLTGELQRLFSEQSKKRGSGIRILTGRVTSPTLQEQLQALAKRFPDAKWVTWEPIGWDNVYEGSRQAFGKSVETHLELDKARMIVSLDSDFLYSHPAALRYDRQFSEGRRLWTNPKTMNRLYVVEGSSTITGSMADHRLPLRSGDVERIARELGKRIGIGNLGSGGGLTSEQERWVASAAKDLSESRGAGVVIAGEWQPPVVHALAHSMNSQLGSFGQTVRFSAPIEAKPEKQLAGLVDLVSEMKAGKVDVLLILGGNPVFTAPVDLDFADALRSVKQSFHLSLYYDETAAACSWHIPETHFLEAWSDVRAFNGVVSIVQPLIAPLYNGLSVHELLATILGPFGTSSYDVVRQYWSRQGIWKDFEAGWRSALNEGYIDGTAAKAVDVSVSTDAFADYVPSNPEVLEIAFRPDPNLWDGTFSPNGWLQETPHPITKIMWDNAALIGSGLAAAKGLKDQDLVELQFGGRRIEIPVFVTPGHADGSVTLHLGNGRKMAGWAGSEVGFDCYKLRSSSALWNGKGGEVRKLGKSLSLARSQLNQKYPDKEREVLRTGNFDGFRKDPSFARESAPRPEREETLYNPGEHAYGGYKWAMVIDQTACIGCNACLVACETENNSPIVGRAEAGKGRYMFWMRVDTYLSGDEQRPQFHHAPMPCMHCEYAPCELVCPVEATLHDHEGLNLQVYNRCVGTRFCSNNCPYKIRRFNFFQYADYKTPGYKPMRNPEVTVRWRGVMEKCTYCVQRIWNARITSEKENRRIADGEVVPACAQACPTRAIIFGDISDPQSAVSKARSSGLNYQMLADLNTQPRTTYLGRVFNAGESGGKG